MFMLATLSFKLIVQLRAHILTSINIIHINMVNGELKAPCESSPTRNAKL